MTCPLLGPWVCRLSLKHCVIPYSFPSWLPGFILSATFSCVLNWLWSRISSKFLVSLLFLVFAMISHWMEFTHQSSLVPSNMSPLLCACCTLSAPGCLLWGLPVNQLAFIVTRVIQASLQGLKSSTKFKPLNLKSSVFPTKNQVSIIGLPRPSDRCTKSLLSYGLDSNLVIKFLVCPMLGLVCCSRIFQGHIQNQCIHMCVCIYIYIHIYVCTNICYITYLDHQSLGTKTKTRIQFKFKFSL